MKLQSNSSSSAPAELKKKYMCVNPYEGMVCKRDGNYMGIAMPNFRTCYAIIIISKNSLLGLHYPSRVYSRQLPDSLKKWWAALSKEKIEKALIVLNKNYAAVGSFTEHNVDNFQTQLNEDMECEFKVVEATNLFKNDLLIVNAATGVVSLLPNDITAHPAHYANFPMQPASRLRYYSCRAQFFTQNDNFPVKIIGSKNFFAPVDEKEWPIYIGEHIKLLKQKKKTALQTIAQDLMAASIDKSHNKHCLAMAIGLEGVSVPNNLKKYFYLLLSLMHSVDQTVELQSFKEQVDNIESTLGFSR